MDLVDALRKGLGETFAFSMEARFFHWNVTGPTFSQLHELFSDIYEDVDGAIDGLAEHIRTLGDDAPHSLAEIVNGAEIVTGGDYDADGMVAKLAADNAIVMACLGVANESAEEEGHPEIANYLQERMDKHAKWGWFLKSTAEGDTSGKRRPDVLHDHPRSLRSGD